MPKNVNPLRIGVMGCGNIARQFVAAVATSPHVNVVAAASRNAAKSTEFARSFSLPRSYGSYEALLADDALDIIYVPLPNTMHLEWVVKAAQSGKHVLSEKPLALTLSEARTMFDAVRASGVMLLEAYPYWFQPQTRDMLALIHSGAIGDVRSVQASFGFNLGHAPGNIRMKPDMGGGALLDAGSYGMSLIRLAMGDAPERVMAHATLADSGVDISTSATLFFSGGRTAQLHCAMNVGYHRLATILGSNGVIETEFLNHTSSDPTQAHQASQMRLRRGFAGTIPLENIQSATGSGFAFCAEAFAKVIHDQDFAAIEHAAQASCDIAVTLEAIALSARSGQGVEVKTG
jgi:predicted dehydrogenase